MKTIVKHIEGTNLTATIKKHLIAVVESGNKDYFGRKLKVNRIKMMVEDLGNDTYNVTEYLNRPSMISAGNYETEFKSTVKLITK